MPDGAQGRIEKAKALLAQAGHADGVDVELFASEAVANSIPMATAYAEQAKAAGIRIKVRQWPAGTYYDEVWLKKPFYADVWNRRHPMDAMVTFCVSKAAWNEAKFKNPEFDATVTKALGTAEEPKRRQHTADALAMLGEDSGYIIPVFASRLVLHPTALRGLVSNYDTLYGLRGAWIES